ncbi:DinB family protein [Nibrella saemangeumensis]|uniref:DinB family protein n=1 Tax=Nibrella saemangeumensis TaxID=1084526 RepID=A0ABP8MUM6_9BACT
MQKLETAYQLQDRLRAVLITVETEFRPLSPDQLSWRPAPDRWSIGQCLQHLNLAERFYIRNLQKKIDDLGLIQAMPTDQLIESDWVGRALRYSVDPNTNLKLPAPSLIRPRADLDEPSVLSQFVELQQLLHDLLDKAIYLDWNKTRMMSLFGNWIKIRLGDALIMLVLHTERHIRQALRVKEEMSTFVKTA